MERIIFIADGGPDIGGGHISRCLSLAGGFKSLGEHEISWLVPGGAVSFLNESSLAAFSPVFNGVFPFPELLSGAMEKSDLIIADSYRITCHVLDYLRSFAPVVVVDDYRNRPVEEHSDILLNYNLGAESVGYGSGSAFCLLGPEYSLLRPSFASLAVKNDGYLLFVAGSYDMMKASITVARWYDDSWPPLRIVLGPMNRDAYIEEVKSIASEKKGLSILVAPDNFDELMAGSSCVISTSSVTSYEALALDKPLIVFQVAENQVKIGEEIGRLKWGINLGWWNDVSRDDLTLALSSVQSPPPDCINLCGAKKAAKAILKEMRSCL